jgi:hypothetical protein
MDALFDAMEVMESREQAELHLAAAPIVPVVRARVVKTKSGKVYTQVQKDKCRDARNAYLARQRAELEIRLAQNKLMEQYELIAGRAHQSQVDVAEQCALLQQHTILETQLAREIAERARRSAIQNNKRREASQSVFQQWLLARATKSAMKTVDFTEDEARRDHEAERPVDYSAVVVDDELPELVPVLGGKAIAKSKAKPYGPNPQGTAARVKRATSPKVMMLLMVALLCLVGGVSASALESGASCVLADAPAMGHEHPEGGGLVCVGMNLLAFGLFYTIFRVVWCYKEIRATLRPHRRALMALFCLLNVGTAMALPVRAEQFPAGELSPQLSGLVPMWVWVAVFASVGLFLYLMHRARTDFHATARDLVNRADAQAERFNRTASDLTQKVDAHAEKFNSSVDKASDSVSQTVGKFATVMACTEVIGAVLLLGKYYHARRVEKKEGKLSEKEVFHLFDLCIIAMAVPTLYYKGMGGAVAMWRSLKTVCTLVRDFCGGIRVLTRFLSVPAKDARPSLGASFVAGAGPALVPFGDEQVASILDVTEELVQRVEEKSQGKSDDELDAALLSMRGGLSDSALEKAGFSERLNTPTHDGLRTLWGEQEAKMKKMCEGRPWLGPVLVIFSVAALLVVIRHFSVTASPNVSTGCFHADNCPSLKAGKVASQSLTSALLGKEAICNLACGGHHCTHFMGCKPITEESRVRGCMHAADCPGVIAGTVCTDYARECDLVCGGHHCTHWRSCAPETLERKTANKKKPNPGWKRKPWVDYSGPSGDATEPLFYTGEDGNLYRRLGRRAARHGTEFVINQQRGDYGTIREGLAKAGSMKGVTFERVSEIPEGVSTVWEVKGEGQIFIEKCKNGNCAGTCGKWHPHQRKADKIKKQVEADALKKERFANRQCFKCGSLDHIAKACVKKEGLVNGPRFESATIAKAVGRAVAGKQEMCATMIWNGVLTCKHLFDGCMSAMVTFGDKCAELKVEHGKEVGRDLLYFPAPKELQLVPRLRAAKCVVGTKVEMVTYDTLDDARVGKFKHDAGVVRIVLDGSMEEKAYSRYSSVAGSCGSPVVDTAGKVVGIHTGTTSEETVFVPITANIVFLATGSRPSF